MILIDSFYYYLVVIGKTRLSAKPTDTIKNLAESEIAGKDESNERKILEIVAFP